MKKIAFDVDDTLIVPSVANDTGRDVPNYPVIELYKMFESQGCYMIIWSGSGVDYASTWSEKLGLKPHEVRPKEKSFLNGDVYVDIAFDDCDVDLAKVNIKIKRINNSISRKEWNVNKK